MRSAQSSAMKQMIMEGDSPYLPSEIIRNILKRLPVKSLIRFQCVCKDWKNLSKTPSFIEDHLHHSTHQNPYLVFHVRSTHYPLQLYMLDREMQVLGIQRPPSTDDLFDPLPIIIGSINGLICVSLTNSSHAILLWNPAIRQVKLVAGAEGKFFKLGFGFSSIVNDHKILRINFNNVRVNRGEVYSLKTGLWKKVESGTLDGVAIKFGSFAANGNIFWFGFERNVEGRDHLLVSYDIAMEVFSLIPLPISTPKPKLLDSLYKRLAVHENKLALLSHTTIGDFESSLIDLWVMEEGAGTSGERWSWTKKYSIGHPCLLLPETIWRNEMVCHREIVPRHIRATERGGKDDERNAVLVNLTTNEFKNFDIPKYGVGCHMLSYVESLVPVGYGGIEEL